MTQEERMLKALKKAGRRGIPNHKFHDLRILSHTKIISNLREDGHVISKELVRLPNGRSTGVYVYTLEEQELETAV